MTIPANLTLEGAPYGVQPVVPCVGPQGGPYTVIGLTPINPYGSGSRTASSSGAANVNIGFRGVLLDLNVSANPGGGETLSMVIETQDPNSGAWRPILTLAPSITPSGQIQIYPGLSGAAVEAVLATRNLYLPGQWRVRMIHSAGGAWIYSVNGWYLP